MIPEAAVEAALTALDQSWIADASREQWGGILRDILEAAEPHMHPVEPGSVVQQAMELAWDEGNRIGYQDRGREAQGAKLRTNPYRSQP